VDFNTTTTRAQYFIPVDNLLFFFLHDESSDDGDAQNQRTSDRRFNGFTAKQGTGIGYIRIGINGRLYCFFHAIAGPDKLYITFPFSLLPVPRDSFHLIPRFL
jgi:hypothetical protein